MKKETASTSLKSFYPGDHQAIYEKLKKFAKQRHLSLAEAQIELVCLGLEVSETTQEKETDSEE